MTEEKKNQKENFILKIIHNIYVIRIFLFAVVITACYFAVKSPDDIHKYRLGQIVQDTFKAKVGFVWVKKIETENEKKRAVSSLPLYLKISPESNQKIEQDISRFLEKIRNASEKSGNEEPFPVELTALIKSLRREDLGYYSNMSGWKEILEKVLADGVIAEEWKKTIPWGKEVVVKDPRNRSNKDPRYAKDLRIPKDALKEVFHKGLTGLPASVRTKLADELAGKFAKLWRQGNLEENREDRENAETKALAAVKSVEGKIDCDEIVLRKNQKMTQQEVDKYNAYLGALHKKDFSPGEIVRKLFSLMMILFVIILGIWSTRRKLLQQPSQMALLALIAVSAVLMNKYAVSLFVRVSDAYPGIISDMIYFSLPLGFGVILASVFFGTRTALFLGFFISVMASMHLPEQFFMMFSGCFIIAGTAVIMRNVTNYREFFLKAFIGCGGTAFVISVVSLIQDDGQLLSIIRSSIPAERKEGILILIWYLLIPFVSGLLTAIIGQLAVYLLEFLFDVCSPMYIQTYGDLNSPLLTKLQMEAPGTYHHCQMVSLIAEQAARAIHADHVRARVCSLYHDIGKLRQPEYFIENSSGVNRHQGVAPSVSAMIILNHVKYGLELAKRYKLKKPFKEAIAQHHGTSFVLAFYLLAEKEAKEKGTSVIPSEYRYDGPCPISKENSILMLADCCEAASRNLSPEGQSLEEAADLLVKNIISGKIRDGQLQDSELTMRDLNAVHKSIVKTLVSSNHKRNQYPQVKKEDHEDDLFMASGKGNVSASGTEKIQTFR